MWNHIYMKPDHLDGNIYVPFNTFSSVRSLFSKLQLYGSISVIFSLLNYFQSGFFIATKLKLNFEEACNTFSQ